MTDFPQGARPLICDTCRMRSPKRAGTCVLCALLGIVRGPIVRHPVEPPAPTREPLRVAPEDAPRIVPLPVQKPPPLLAGTRAAKAWGIPGPAISKPNRDETIYGTPHPDPAIEAEARRRAGAPPTASNPVRWKRMLVLQRLTVEAAWKDRDEALRQRAVEQDRSRVTLGDARGW